MECTDVQLIIVSVVLLGVAPSLYSVSYRLNMYMYSIYHICMYLITIIIVAAPSYTIAIYNLAT